MLSIQTFLTFIKKYIFSHAKIKFCILFCLYLIFRRRRIIKKRLKDGRPPGPTGIPFFGSLPFIWQFNNTKNHLIYMRNLGKKYDGICTLPIGQSEVILINDLGLLRDMLSKKEISDRSPIFIDIVGDGKTHATMNGEYWLTNKKITQDVINQFAIRNIDRNLHKALVEELFPKLEKENVALKKPFYCRAAFRHTFFWVFFRIIYGEKATYEPIDQITYDTNLNKHLKYRIVPYTLSSHILGRYYYVCKYMGDSFYKYHNEYLEVLQKYWDIYVNKDENEKEDCIIKELFNSNMDRGQIFNEMTNVMGGAIDNTSNVIRSVFFNLGMDNPKNIQNILYDELMEVHKKANKSDFDYSLLRNCHKLRAFIHESMRLHIPNPLGATRYCNKDINVKYKDKTYLIKEGSVIWWNVASTTYDNKYWDNDKFPNDEFRLERFLENNDINGKFVNRNDLMIFGYGKRKCTGRLIVIREFVHIAAHFIWRYKMKLTDKDQKNFKNLDDVKSGIGFTDCKPYGLILQPRD